MHPHEDRVSEALRADEAHRAERDPTVERAAQRALGKRRERGAHDAELSQPLDGGEGEAQEECCRSELCPIDGPVRAPRIWI